jgi:hypothetical protein
MVNPDWNAGIAKLLPHDYQASHIAYHELKKRWPQINQQTKVTFTGYHQIQMVEFLPIPMRQKRIPISGLSMLRIVNSHFSLKQLDDPQERKKYHVDLIHAILHVPMYAIWRFAGRLFKRDEWIKRGTGWVYDDDLPASAPMPPTRTIELTTFGVQWHERDGMQRFYLVCGYDPLSDTFLVRK